MLEEALRCVDDLSFDFPTTTTKKLLSLQVLLLFHFTLYVSCAFVYMYDYVYFCIISFFTFDCFCTIEINSPFVKK